MLNYFFELDYNKMRCAVLYFFKPVNKFEEEYKANYSDEVKHCCKHSFIFLKNGVDSFTFQFQIFI